MVYSLVLFMSFYRGGVGMIELKHDYPTLEICQKVGRIVQSQARDMDYVCVPSPSEVAK
jgi:hypothetical protein